MVALMLSFRSAVEEMALSGSLKTNHAVSGIVQ